MNGLVAIIMLATMRVHIMPTSCVHTMRRLTVLANVARVRATYCWKHCPLETMRIPHITIEATHTNTALCLYAPYGLGFMGSYGKQLQL